MALQSDGQRWQSYGAGAIFGRNQDLFAARDIVYGPHEGRTPHPTYLKRSMIDYYCR